MKRIVVSALLLSLAATASAQTKAQTDAINNVNIARVISEECSTLKLNTIMAAAILMKNKVEIGRGEKHFEAFVISHRLAQQKMATIPNATVCASGILMFGPSGKVAKDLLTDSRD